MSRPIDGYCPMGCGQTLRTRMGTVDQEIRCWSLTCPRPTAAAELLSDSETEHRVVFDGAGFTIRHPLRERLDDALLKCDLHWLLANLSEQPVEDGEYRAIPDPDGEFGDEWRLERIED